MLHAYENIGAGIISEQKRKDRVAAYQEDMAQIAPALESMLQILNEGENDNIKDHIKGLLEDVLKGKEVDTSGFFQKSSHELILGNEIYRRDLDDNDIRSEIEILNAATVCLYNEQGETLDDITMDLFGLFSPSDSGSDSDNSGDFVNYVLEEMVDSIKEYYDPGKILQDGDIRITTQTLKQVGSEEYAHYFFRGSEFLYSINTMTGEVVYGENYDRILAEMLQDTIDQMP
jgi:hypothetical protein